MISINMLSKNEVKTIRNLKDKKERQQTGLFLIEGGKSILEAIGSDFDIETIIVTNEFFNEHKDQIIKSGKHCEIVEQSELETLGTLESNNAGLVVAKQKPNTEPEIGDEIILALDEVKDPGNLGTIIRIADWYGIKKIIASNNSTDFYNSKTISATMGSFTRVQIYYTELKDYLAKINRPILGAFMNGQNVHNFSFPKTGVLLMGNESNGIHKELEDIVTDKITIPRHGGAESLNVSVATAVILDNWKR